MKAEEAYKLSCDSQNSINIEKFSVLEALDEVKKATEMGEFECIYWNDDEVRDALRLMGYNVSEMWKDPRWYYTEYMTISWYK